MYDEFVGLVRALNMTAMQDVWQHLKRLSFQDAANDADDDDDAVSDKAQEDLRWLERLSTSLAQSDETRKGIFRLSTEGERIDVLRSLSEKWLQIVKTCADDAADTDEEEESEGGRIQEVRQGKRGEEHQRLEMRKAMLLARFIRNAVADNTTAQNESFIVLPQALSSVWLTTSFGLEGRLDAQSLMRTLVQMLSNILTENEGLQHKFWNDVFRSTNGKGRSVIDLFCRLLTTPDKGTQSATQILLVNLVMQSRTRTVELASDKTWLPVLRALLHTIDMNLEDDEAEEEEAEAENSTSDGDSGYGVSLLPSTSTLQRQQARYESLGIIYALFTHLFRQGLFDHVFVHLTSSDDVHGSSIDASLITASQITLLKLFDAFLHKRASSVRSQELPSTFVRLARWSTDVMESTMKAGPSASVDGRLVEVHVGFILILQCLISLTMAAEKNDKIGALETFDAEAEAIVERVRSDEFIASLLELMRITSAFSPAVTPFKPSAAVQQAASRFPSAPEGHVYSSTGKEMKEQRDNQQTRPDLDKLKRDMMGLLGALSFQRGPFDVQDVQRVQNVVRERGGLLVVLDLTQLDERNPYIRERAIFALRNLLQGNQASQDLIAQLQPLQPVA